MKELDTEFHLIIYRACRSKALRHICRGLSGHTLKCRLAGIHAPDIARHARLGRARILQALRGNPPAGLDRAIALHLAQVQKDIPAHLTRPRQTPVAGPG
jgi:DNA-binding FadR family transcriptional regulator